MKGICHKYGDHIDTDVIIPARYLNDPRRENLAAHCMEDIDAQFPQKVKAGDIMVECMPEKGTDVQITENGGSIFFFLCWQNYMPVAYKCGKTPRQKCQ